jgi:hypothetical protein
LGLSSHSQSHFGITKTLFKGLSKTFHVAPLIPGRYTGALLNLGTGAIHSMSSDTLVKSGSGIRKHPRIGMDISARVFCKGGASSLARAHDISCGGLSLYAPMELAKGDVIKIAFELPHSRMRFGVSAVVKNRDGFRYGVEFLELTPQEFAEIKRVTKLLAIV